MTMLNEDMVKEMKKYDDMFNGFSYNDIIEEEDVEHDHDHSCEHEHAKHRLDEETSIAEKEIETEQSSDPILPSMETIEVVNPALVMEDKLD
jgi:hypothetical protein